MKSYVYVFELGALLALVGCEEKGGVSPAPTSSPSVAASASAPAPVLSGGVSAAVAAVSAVPSPSQAAVGSVAPTPSAPKGSASAVASASPSATASAAKGAAKPVGMHVTGNNFAVDVSAPGDCKANAPCSMAIRLSALGAYHINDEYPYKWKGDPVDGIEYTGNKDGAFKKEDATHATMLVTFKSAAQPARVAGEYRLSVCSEDKCQIEKQRIELSVPMM